MLNPKIIGVSTALGAGFVLGPLYLAIGIFALGYFIGENRGRAHVIATERQLRAGAPRSAGEKNLPGPLAVLAGMLTENREPPPFVIHCAIAEAKLIGRHDVANGLYDRFVAPSAIDAESFEPAQRPDVPAPEHAQEQDAQDAPMIASGEVQPPLEMNLDRSPLPEIHDDAWLVYKTKLAQKDPGFNSTARVGRYEHSKKRLRELGYDPDLLVKHPRAEQLQEAALAIDTVDHARHLISSGTAEAYMGKVIGLPHDSNRYAITMSGLLGVAQAAGLEKAISWLEHPSDRKEYPHTTATFVRCNGVF